MGKELPIVAPPPKPATEEEQQTLSYTRVFCMNENSPPLRLLLDYLKSRGQTPLHAKMEKAALDDWAWVQITLGYDREKKPIQLFCSRNKGSYQDVLEKEREQFLERLAVYDDEEAGLIRHYVEKANFLVTAGFIKTDITEEGYDFNGWILEFFQENCNGVVQVDGHGFFSPKGDLVIEMGEE